MKPVPDNNFKQEYAKWTNEELLDLYNNRPADWPDPKEIAALEAEMAQRGILPTKYQPA